MQWWNNATIRAFRERAQCIIDQYSKYKLDEVDLYVNGRMTQGENIADNGGLKQSFRVSKIDFSFVIFMAFLSHSRRLHFLPKLSLEFDVFLTVHHSIELFHQPTLMHNFFYSLTVCLLHYYLRHVSSINMPIFRRKNYIHTASGIFALCKRLHSKLVESRVYCADVYRERRYQMLYEYNFSS